MYDKEKNRLTFPHTIPGVILAGKRHDVNCINGGTKKIADLNIQQNSFWGGNVQVVGLINEYGFYGCPNRFDRTFMGFYIHDGKMVTEQGKRILADRFPNIEIVYDSVIEDDRMNDEDIKHMKALKEEAMRVGVASNMVTHTTAKELENLIKAVTSGVNPKANIEVELPIIEATADDFNAVDQFDQPRRKAKLRS